MAADYEDLGPDPAEVARLKRELYDALVDEQDAASRASAILQELEDLGVDTAGLDTRP